MTTRTDELRSQRDESARSDQPHHRRTPIHPGSYDEIAAATTMTMSGAARARRAYARRAAAARRERARGAPRVRVRACAQVRGAQRGAPARRHLIQIRRSHARSRRRRTAVHALRSCPRNGRSDGWIPTGAHARDRGAGGRGSTSTMLTGSDDQRRSSENQRRPHPVEDWANTGRRGAGRARRGGRTGRNEGPARCHHQAGISGELWVRGVRARCVRVIRRNADHDFTHRIIN